MKRSIYFCFAIALVFSCFSTEQVFAQKLISENSFVVEAGVGIVPGVGNRDFYSREIPPLRLTAEMAIVKGIFGDKDFFSLGLGGGYFKYAYMDTSYHVGHIQALVNYRYPLAPRLTAYVGYALGYYFDSYNRETELFSGYDGLFSEVYLGLGYYFYKNIGAFAKVSSGEVLVEAGVSIR